MEKIKIHELAKKLNKSSKEIMEMATKFGAEIKSHLSTVEANVASKIEKEMKDNSNTKLIVESVKKLLVSDKQ